MEKIAKKEEIVEKVMSFVAADPAAKAVFESLSPFGEIFVVGGAVRDVILGNKPKDIDMMARIHPETINQVLGSIPKGKLNFTGKDFGVFRFTYGGSEVEIALPRTEVSTGPGHKDFEVQTNHELPVEEDLKRRDFTGNALAVDLNRGELIDPHMGHLDLLGGVLRTTNPHSFRDDPLRTIRALVARSRHGLEPDPETAKQMAMYAPGVIALPGERIQAELEKLMKGDHPHEAIRLGQQAGVLEHFLPEVSSAFGFDQKNPHHKLDLGEHLLEVLKNVAAQTTDPDVRLAGLLHDIGKPASQWIDDNGIGHYYRSPDGRGQHHEEVGAQMAENVLGRLRYPTNRIAKVSHLIRNHMFPDFNSPKGARGFLRRAGSHESAHELLNLRQADHMGKGNEIATARMVNRMRELVQQEQTRNSALTVKDLAISGRDVMNTLGLPPSKKIGEVLNELLDLVTENPELNTRENLLQHLQGLKISKMANNANLSQIFQSEQDDFTKLDQMLVYTAHQNAKALGMDPNLLANDYVIDRVREYVEQEINQIHNEGFALNEEEWWQIFRTANQFMDEMLSTPDLMNDVLQNATVFHGMPEQHDPLERLFDMSPSASDSDFLKDLGIKW